MIIAKDAFVVFMSERKSGLAKAISSGVEG